MTQTNEKLGKLPTWDLTEFYPSHESPEFQSDIATLRSLADSFQKYKNEINDSTSPSRILMAIADYEEIVDLSYQLQYHAHLNYTLDTGDGVRLKQMSDMNALDAEIEGKIVFFTLALNGISDEVIETWNQNPAMADKMHWIKSIRRWKPYELDDRTEQIFNDVRLVSENAWISMHEKIENSMTFKPLNHIGEPMQLEEALNVFNFNPDRDARRNTALEIGKVFTQKADLFAHVLNAIAKNREIDDKWHNYMTGPENAMHSRVVDDCVSIETAKAMADAVTNRYDIAHRFYRLKAKLLNLDKMEYWDRNAPIPSQSTRTFTWDEAREIVIDAYAKFDARLGEIAKMAFAEGWMDAPMTKGKRSGAFSSQGTISTHPWILLNYQGTLRDVTVVAHELGHGIHQYLSQEQGTLMHGSTLVMAEVASIFGEMLTFNSLLEQIENPEQRFHLKLDYLNDSMNTIVRQIAFHNFESEIHARRIEGELTVDDIRDIWFRTQSDSYGSAIDLDQSYQDYWVYISHFIHTPFYVYSYAFSALSVIALEGLYMKKVENFNDNYIEVLRNGKAENFNDMVARFGFDGGTSFWNQGLDVIERQLTDLEEMQ